MPDGRAHQRYARWAEEKFCPKGTCVVRLSKRKKSMATAGIQFKIMPEGLETDLEKLKVEIKTKVETFESGVLNEIKEEPIAFGLKALIVTIALSEDEESDKVETSLSEIDKVSSVEMIDYRRVVG